MHLHRIFILVDPLLSLLSLVQSGPGGENRSRVWIISSESTMRWNVLKMNNPIYFQPQTTVKTIAVRKKSLFVIGKTSV